MSVPCPYCQQAIKPRAVKPGRFQVTCPRCGQALVLIVPESPDEPMSAAPIQAAPSSAPPTKPSPPPRPPAPTPGSPPKTVPRPAPRPGPGKLDENQPTEGKAVPLPAEAAGRKPSGEPGPEGLRPAASVGNGTRVVGGNATLSGESTDFEVDKGLSDLPETLGGYRILKKLGQGGMGAVYLARQLSLDRPVALKTMHRRLARDPSFLARFTREAHAAARLVHHHIVQIYDIGADKGVHYFSMEFVQGKTLGRLLLEQGPLAVPTAVGYILQAARGLKFAHEQGMVHRDIKPDNLLLNEQGLIKVADLGLVKTPETVDSPSNGEAAAPGSPPPASVQVTHAGLSLGTPAYMSPEQGRSASRVDHRADIYSLGCTLYVLLTGQQPFRGKTANEVIIKHFTDPIVRPEHLVQQIPGQLSDILVKMLAKKPEDRYQDMGAVIAELERFLAGQPAGVRPSREEQARVLESCARQYHEAPAARLRSKVCLIFLAACTSLFLLALLARWPLLTWASLSVGLLTALATFLINGVAFKTHLFIQSRELLLLSSRSDWLIGMAACALGILALYLIGLLWWSICFLSAALVLAALFHLLIEQKLARQRQLILEQVEALLRTLRQSGLDEEAIQQFVFANAGNHWEPLFEALFGYEHLVHARRQWARLSPGKRRHRHAGWRDPILRWIEKRRQSIKQAQELRYLRQLELQQLEAQRLRAAAAMPARVDPPAVPMTAVLAVGVPPLGGLAKAEDRLKAELQHAPQAIPIPQAPPMPSPEPPRIAVPVARVEPPVKIPVDVPLAAEIPEDPGHCREATPLIETPQPPEQPRLPIQAEKSVAQRLAELDRRRRIARLLYGVHTRFLLGTVLVGLCVWWLQQNEPLRDQVVNLLSNFDLAVFTSPQATTPFSIFSMPPLVVGEMLFNSFNPAVAGLLLILSTGCESRKVVAGFGMGALIVFLGQWALAVAGIRALDLPGLGSVKAEHLSLAAGVAVAVLSGVVAAVLERGE